MVILAIAAGKDGSSYVPRLPAWTLLARLPRKWLRPPAVTSEEPSRPAPATPDVQQLARHSSSGDRGKDDDAIPVAEEVAFVTLAAVYQDHLGCILWD